MAQADTELLSLLEKAANPVQSIDFTLSLKGVYAPPEQWKLSDEANPGVFTYSLKVMNFQFSSGKIEPRKLTEAQVRQQEEARNKKGGKKEAKDEEPPEEQDPDAEKKRLEWEALSEEEKFYRTQEDPYKAFSLLFQQSQINEGLSGEALKQFQGHINKGEVVICLTRGPAGGEEDVAKLKKAKSKTLNLGELYDAKYEGKLDLGKFSMPGQSKMAVRVPIQFQGEAPNDCIVVNAEQCYILVELSLSQPLTPLIEEVTPTTQQILGGQKVAQSGGSDLVSRLRSQINRAVRAISQEYAAFFVKQKEHPDDKKGSSWINNSTGGLNISALRVSELNKRKEAFLQELVSSGKYGVLAERVGKVVKAVVVDKCRKEKMGACMTKVALQKTLSELNLYLRQLLQHTLEECLKADAPLLHEDVVLGHEMVKATRQQAVSRLSETSEVKELRLAQQYETANQIPQAEEKYLNRIALEKTPQVKEAYARFCLRHHDYDKAFALYRQLQSEGFSFERQMLLTLFLLQRERTQEATDKLLKLQEQNLNPSEKMTVHHLLYYAYKRSGQQKKSQKHLGLAEKYYLFQTNPNMRITHIQNPYVQPTPKVPKPDKFVSQLSIGQNQEMKEQLLNLFIQHQFTALAQDYLPQVPDSKHKSLLTAKTQLGQRQYSQALQTVEGLLEKQPTNEELLGLKATICFLSERIFECEEVFLTLLHFKPQAGQAYSIYIRLGLTYLSRKSWEDAKQTFDKAVEIRPNSSIGWLGLGEAHLQLGELKQSEEAFNLSSIYNPLASEPQEGLSHIRRQIAEQHEQEYKRLSNG